jgi:RNA polymerase sigma-70 factor (ECF subfamily)
VVNWDTVTRITPGGATAGQPGGRGRVATDGMRTGVAQDGFDAFLGDEEQLLVHEARGGDRDAFARLVERYWDRLYRWLYHLAHDAHAAEDLAQETFLKAYARLDSFRPGSNFKAWLFRIGHNNFVNLHRGRAAAAVRVPMPESLPAGGDGPVEEALGREALAALTRAVGRLPADFRAAFLLRAEEGLSFREIADVQGTTEQTARWRVFKARQKLLQALPTELLPPAVRPETG